MSEEKAPGSGAFFPASLMYFCSGKPMHLCSGVDSNDAAYGFRKAKMICALPPPELTAAAAATFDPMDRDENEPEPRRVMRENERVMLEYRIEADLPRPRFPTAQPGGTGTWRAW